MDLSIGNRVFYTRSTGVRIPSLGILSRCSEGGKLALQDWLYLLHDSKFQFTTSLLTQPLISISIWWVVFRVVTGKLTYYWALCACCAHAVQKRPLTVRLICWCPQVFHSLAPFMSKRPHPKSAENSEVFSSPCLLTFFNAAHCRTECDTFVAELSSLPTLRRQNSIIICVGFPVQSAFETLLGPNILPPFSAAGLV